MLQARILLGGLLIAGLIGLLWLDYHAETPATWLFWLVLAVGLAAAQEVLALLAQGGYHPLASSVYGGTLLVVGSNAISIFWQTESDGQPIERLGWPLVAFSVAVLFALAGEMARYRRPGGVMANVGLAVFAIAYVGLLLSFTLQLRTVSPEGGMVALAALVIVVKLGDTGAYTVGRLMGRHKMAPSISPGKTIEGGIGGMIAACAGSWFALSVLPGLLQVSVPQNEWSWLVFGLAVGAAGMIGDLAESMFKRDMGAKDSSHWLPGFGGFLDLLDSILFAAPVAYLCWVLG